MSTESKDDGRPSGVVPAGDAPNANTAKANGTGGKAQRPIATAAAGGADANGAGQIMGAEAATNGHGAATTNSLTSAAGTSPPNGNGASHTNGNGAGSGTSLGRKWRLWPVRQPESDGLVESFDPPEPMLDQAEWEYDEVEEHRLEGFDLWSVAKFSTIFFICVLAAIVIGVLVLWIAANMLGLVDGFERFMRGVGFTHFQVLSGELLIGLALVAACWVVLMVALTVIGAGLYNVLARSFGGVHVRLSPVDTWSPLDQDVDVDQDVDADELVVSNVANLDEVRHGPGVVRVSDEVAAPASPVRA